MNFIISRVNDVFAAFVCAVSNVMKYCNQCDFC